jgi:DNA mismatch repair protein MutS2
MNDKTFFTLEMNKVLVHLASHTSFSGGEDLALTLMPTTDLAEARLWLQQTTEARILLEEHPEQFHLGGVHDVRGAALSTTRGMVLEPSDLLDIRATLRRATLLRRLMVRLRGTYPLLATLAEGMEESAALQHEIGRVIGEDARVLDSASPRLAIIRHDLKVAFDRLQSKLNAVLNAPSHAPYLQEQIITQRNGRYVIPIKAEFKGRIPGIIHDQSASGATLWIEPLKTVENNNQYRELQLDEEKEIRRILRELCELVAAEAPAIVRTVDALCQLDLISAKARYANALNAHAPQLVEFNPPPGHTPQHSGATLRLVQARHPLLDPEKVVPIDLELDPETYALVLTGPNTGGKTVVLKTVGLMVLMAQCGLHLPTDVGSRLSVFKQVFADIGDEQSIEQSLSTFSGHMKNIIQILAEADRHALVILDELGAGTDPAEGSALARAILNRLLDSGITTLVTTHHPELKIYAQERRGARNASMEFNLETLAPTYRLVVGLPGRSNALAIATRLGLPQDIVEAARSMVTLEDLVADDLLDEIHKTREETRQAYARAAQLQQEAEALRQTLRQELEDLETQRRDVLAEARRKAEYELEQLRKEIKRLKRDLQNARQPLDALKQVEKLADDLNLEVEVPPRAAKPAALEESPRKFRLGDRVWLSRLMTEGQIIELSADQAEIAIGQMKVKVPLSDLEHRKEERNPRKGSKKVDRATTGDNLPERAASPGLELDIRGSTSDDALSRVQDYVDAAYMAQLPFVRIIHGKGTGVLRRAVRELLSAHSLVAKYSAGTDKEGGDGVTVVTLVSSL